MSMRSHTAAAHPAEDVVRVYQLARAKAPKTLTETPASEPHCEPGRSNNLRRRDRTAATR